MSTFYEKLSMKLQGEGGASAPVGAAPSSKSVTYNAAGGRITPKSTTPDPAAAGQGTAAAPEVTPEGSDPIDIDLFQSESRMVIFMQLPGISSEGFDITINEESNTLIIEVTQKRLSLPLAKGAKEGDAPEKGIYTKQEIKWRALYRKVYLPAPFDSGEATAVLDRGILVITLPAKMPGAGKKLIVRESAPDEHKK